jgi:hypothetical protein
MATSYTRGHKIFYDFDNKIWRYSDDNSPCNYERPCKKCSKMPTPEGYDACLGYLEGIKSACCGHGVEEPYATTRGKKILKGQ